MVSNNRAEDGCDWWTVYQIMFMKQTTGPELLLGFLNPVVWCV